MNLFNLQKAMNICMAFLFVVLLISCSIDPNGKSFPDYFQDAKVIELERVPFLPSNNDLFFRNMFGLYG